MNELIHEYTRYDEDARLISQWVTRLEFETTLHILAPYLRTPVNVCELGAATGRYSLMLAAQGHTVTAVELVPAQVQRLREKAAAQALELVIHEGNACQIPFVEDASQDLCLILGPLYHLKTLAERQQVLQEAHRILKPGGSVAVAYISRFFIVGLLAQTYPALLTPEVLQEVHDTGCISCQAVSPLMRLAYYATPAEMETLLREQEIQPVLHVATEGLSKYLASHVNAFSPEQYATWRDYHFKVCAEPSLLGASNHGLILGKKR